jgi:hypothetical protein
VRDSYTIANIDAVTAWARQQVVKRFGEGGYELHFTNNTAPCSISRFRTNDRYRR